MSPTLLVLAAGMGRRFGALKQMEGFGPNGETLLDYSVYDALQAGFGDVVFVIRRDFEDEFREKIVARYGEDVPVRLAFQELDDIPSDHPDALATARNKKPWGTGHAVHCARNVIDKPFAVVNADDFYGADAYKKLAAFLQDQAAPGHFGMVGYRLDQTLSEGGTVSRGICTTDDRSKLTSVREAEKIGRDQISGAIVENGDPAAELAPETTVSMNCWALHDAVFDDLAGGLAHFLSTTADPATAEFYLPGAIGETIRSGQTQVTVLPTDATWLGVTYPTDRAPVTEALAALAADHTYPSPLWK